MGGIKDYAIKVLNNSEMSLHWPSILTSLCSIDVTYFPFDTQKCPLQFGSWRYTGNEMDCTNYANLTDLNSFVRSIEWELEDSPAVYRVDYYGDLFYPSVTFTINLKRKPLFYVINIICPCLLITFVAVFGFLLPPESGEKVNLSVTVLLSLAVFQLLVLETIPASGETVPFIGIYFMISMVLVGMSCFMTVMVLLTHYKGYHGVKMPAWIQKYIMLPLSYITCVSIQRNERELEVPKDNVFMTVVNGTVHNNIQDDHIKLVNHKKEETSEMSGNTVHAQKILQPLSSTMTDILQRLESIKTYIEDKKNDDIVSDEWNLLSVMLDRVFLVTYFVVTAVVTCSLILPVVT